MIYQVTNPTQTYPDRYTNTKIRMLSLAPDDVKKSLLTNALGTLMDSESRLE